MGRLPQLAASDISLELTFTRSICWRDRRPLPRRACASSYAGTTGRLGSRSMDQRFHSAGRACCSIASMTGCISRSPNPRPGGADWNVRADELSAGRPPSMRWPMSAAIRAITTVGRHTGSPAGPMPTYFPISAARNCGRAAPAFIAAAMARWVEGTATLGPWQVNGDVPQSWLLELLDEGHSDRAVKVEPPPLARLSMSDLQDVIDQHPGQAAEFRELGRDPCRTGALDNGSNAKGCEWR